MFEKLMQAAERAADGVSRRQFLGWLGRGAAAASGVLVGTATATGGVFYCPLYPGSTVGCSGSYVGQPCYIDARTSGKCVQNSLGGCHCSPKRRR